MASVVYQKLKDTHALPSPTGVALEILRLAGDEKTTLDKISKAVESDPAIASRLLKLVNSPFAGVSRRITSVSAAVRLLGMRTVKNLAMGFSLLSNHRQGPCRCFDYQQFWSKSLARAVAGRETAGRIKGFAPDEVFTLGLLVDIGRLGLVTAFPDEYGRILHTAGPIDSARLAVLEREAFGIDHGTLSAEMMGDWRCDEFLCSIVRRLHEGTEVADNSEERAQQFLRVLRFADSVASVLICLPADAEAILELGPQAVALGITESQLDSIFDAIATAWLDAGQIFSVDTREILPLEQLRAQVQVAPKADTTAPATPERPVGPAQPRMRILVVDDDPLALRLIEHHLAKAGHEVITAANGTEALAKDLSISPQMVITDWMMPDIDGLELCRRLRANGDLGFVYVIIVTAQMEKERIVEALNAGADDYVTKPYSAAELLAKVMAGYRVVHLQKELAARSLEIAQYNTRLTVINDKLRTMSITDELTGLPNRREAIERLSEQWSVAQRYGEPLSCIAGDLDWFKQLNDTFGHAGGDQALKEAAQVMRSVLRAGEAVFRMGGEEFLILCPRSPIAAAEKAGERICNAMAGRAFMLDERQVTITISLGVAERLESMKSPDDLLRAADNALYAAKAAGRNRVSVAGRGQEAKAVAPAALQCPHPATGRIPHLAPQKPQNAQEP